MASGIRTLTSARLMSGSVGAGSPRGTSPRRATPRASSWKARAATIPPTTTSSATGRCFKAGTVRPASSTASAATPSASDVAFVLPSPEIKWPARSQKSPWPPLYPNNLGNCVLARNSATPHLKPTSTVSEKKLTTVPARTA